jgi:hypothetical protein
MVITYENEKRLTLFFFLEILHSVWNKRADFLVNKCSLLIKRFKIFMLN